MLPVLRSGAFFCNLEKKSALQALLNSNSRSTVIPTMGEQCNALRIEIPATCRWQVATLPMEAKTFRICYFRDSSTATATETVIPTMGLLPAPRKPIISTSNPPDGGFVPAAQGLLEKESRPFAKQEAHHLKAVCCAFLSWEYLITSTVHETRCFDLIIQLLSSLFHLYHLLTSFNHPPPRVSENKS